jgi:hypothetical protein
MREVTTPGALSRRRHELEDLAGVAERNAGEVDQGVDLAACVLGEPQQRPVKAGPTLDPELADLSQPGLSL